MTEAKENAMRIRKTGAAGLLVLGLSWWAFLSWGQPEASEEKVTADRERLAEGLAAMRAEEEALEAKHAKEMEALRTEARALVVAESIQPSPVIPTDIEGGAAHANTYQATFFAWQEFIALNWPAVPQTGAPGTRGVADTSKNLDERGAEEPVVWETFRSKVEIYPGQNSGNPSQVVAPNGYVDDASRDYGFDAPPRYFYDPARVHTATGEIPPAPGQQAVARPAWVNLDEDNEIDEAAMFAGAADTSPFPGQQFLYTAKANRTAYTYVARNRWWYTRERDETTHERTVPPQKQTADYVRDHKATPPPGSSEYVSFPNGTIEVKAAWRRLTHAEIQSGRYHTNRVRYYIASAAGSPAYREEVWALHIVHKTPTAPYFTFATFEHNDNLVDAAGNPVETRRGDLVHPHIASLPPTDPEIVSIPATATSKQRLEVRGTFPEPEKRLYYRNLPTGLPGDSVPRGPVSIRHRAHSLFPVVFYNEIYQNILRYYAPNSPLQHYKLVNIQHLPLDKAPGVPYTGNDPGNYYLANIVVETDYNLQNFSGKLDNPAHTNGLITDYFNEHNNAHGRYPVGQPAHNTPYAGRFYNMGGCMGCHGNIAELGADFSFIFNGGPVASPEFGTTFPNRSDLEEKSHPK